MSAGLIADGVAWLNRWQGLLGAVVGAIGALFVALIVARAQDARDRRAAGALVHADLVMFWGVWRSLNNRWPQPLVDPEAARQHVWNLLRDRPTLSPLFDASMAKLLEIDPVLDHCLQFFRTEVVSFERGMVRLREHADRFEAASALAPRAQFDVNDTLATFESAAWLADRAEELTLQLVMRRGARLRLLARRVRRSLRRRELTAMDDHNRSRASARTRMSAGG